MFSPLTKDLVEALRRLPGFGQKSAQRLAFHFLSSTGKSHGNHLVRVLEQAIQAIRYCKSCRIYTERDLCDICNNPKRNHKLLCVVETPSDVVALEQTNSYNGVYFVLQGHLSPLDGIGPEEIGIPELLQKLEQAGIEEIILATNTTMEGKATAHYISSHIEGKIKCSQLAHGVPLGGEIEYLDGSTLTLALLSRVLIESETT